MKHRHKLLILLTIVLAAGCGGPIDDRPELGAVTGKVTLDGQPLANARIVFSPVDGGQSSNATSDSSGTFELTYIRDIKGAKIGKHNIKVNVGEEKTIDEETGKWVGGREEVVPKQYNSESTLQKDVVGGDNEINLDLVSG